MAKRRIFVSCGQLTKEEKKLGKDIVSRIDENGMKGFFAQTVHSADELSRAVFKAVRECDGFCAVLHKRGMVRYAGYEPIQRSSVWIQQEIAILMYRRFLQGRPIPIRVFSEEGVLLEGVLKTSIVNPISFKKSDEVLKGITEWVTGPEFNEDPIINRRESLFQRRIQEFSEVDWFLLDLIAAHTNSPGELPGLIGIRNDFLLLYPEPVNKEGSFRKAISALVANGILETKKHEATGITQNMGIAKQWWDLLVEQLRNREVRV